VACAVEEHYDPHLIFGAEAYFSEESLHMAEVENNGLSPILIRASPVHRENSSAFPQAFLMLLFMGISTTGSKTSSRTSGAITLGFEPVRASSHWAISAMLALMPEAGMVA